VDAKDNASAMAASSAAITTTRSDFAEISAGWRFPVDT